jgi:hypothetical protein
MTVRLLADENFNGAVVRGLLRRNPGVDVVHVQDVGLTGSDGHRWGLTRQELREVVQEIRILRRTERYSDMTPDIPRAILDEHPELVQVATALAAYRAGKPVTTPCSVCGEALIVEEFSEVGILVVTCPSRSWL